VKPEIIRIDPERIDRAAVQKAVSLLRREGVLVYPTETVYGLGGNALSRKVYDRVKGLKGGDRTGPMLVLIPDAGAVPSLVAFVPPAARILMERFWPGPLTLVMRTNPQFPPWAGDPGGTLGIRFSPDPVCRILLEEFGNPILSTSANPSGRVPARDAQEAVAYFEGNIDAVIDGGPRLSGVPSTVVDLSQDPPFLIREGAVTRRNVEETIGVVLGSKTR
jgi:L-threonylcarbamoyladenylate synthase